MISTAVIKSDTFNEFVALISLLICTEQTRFVFIGNHTKLLIDRAKYRRQEGIWQDRIALFLLSALYVCISVSF